MSAVTVCERATVNAPWRSVEPRACAFGIPVRRSVDHVLPAYQSRKTHDAKAFIPVPSFYTVPPDFDAPAVNSFAEVHHV